MKKNYYNYFYPIKISFIWLPVYVSAGVNFVFWHANKVILEYALLVTLFKGKFLLWWFFLMVYLKKLSKYFVLKEKPTVLNHSVWLNQWFTHLGKWHLGATCVRHLEIHICVQYPTDLEVRRPLLAPGNFILVTCMTVLATSCIKITAPKTAKFI